MARLTTFKYALDPTPSQRQQCLRYAGAARKAFNWGLALVKQRLDQRRKEVEAEELPFTEVPLSRNKLIPAFNAFKLGPEGEEDGIAFGTGRSASTASRRLWLTSPEGCRLFSKVPVLRERWGSPAGAKGE